MIGDNRPLSELYSEIGDQWADADAAATLLEDLKSAFLSQKMQDHIACGLAVSKAEAAVKASQEWNDYVIKATTARKNANKLRVKLEVIKMRSWENTNQEANNRMASRI